MRGGKLHRVCRAYASGQAGGSSHTRFTFIPNVCTVPHPSRTAKCVSPCGDRRCNKIAGDFAGEHGIEIIQGAHAHLDSRFDCGTAHVR